MKNKKLLKAFAQDWNENYLFLDFLLVDACLFDEKLHQEEVLFGIEVVYLDESEHDLTKDEARLRLIILKSVPRRLCRKRGSGGS